MKDAGQGVRSMQQARALLSIALAAAEDKGFIGSNPVKKVKNPSGSQSTFTPLTIEEVRRLLETFSGTYMSARLHIALICGLRQGESGVFGGYKKTPPLCFHFAFNGTDSTRHSEIQREQFYA